MKYTIMGWQQQKLKDNDLDTTDALILRTIMDRYSTSSMEFRMIDGIKYMWILYPSLLDDLPIVGDIRSLMRRIKKYGDNSLILRVKKYSKNGKGGTYAYIAPTNKLLFIGERPDPMTESHRGCDKIAQGSCGNDTGVMTKSHNKDSSTKDPSTKDYKESLPFEEIVAYLNKKTGRSFKHSTKKTRDLIKSRFNEGFNLDDFKKVIEVKSEEWNGTDMSTYLRPETLFGTKFEGYLNQNIEAPKQTIMDNNIFVPEGARNAKY